MTRNVGTRDRLGRAVASMPLLMCALMAPLPLGARLLGFGAPAAYLLVTAAAGRCLGYRLLGRSTCPVTKART
jgi:hypothetical protein